jgi:hypothetical protein
VRRFSAVVPVAPPSAWITPSTATAAIDHDHRCDEVSLDELERIVI